MKRFYLTNDELNNNVIEGDEYNHIVNVLRMNKGDIFVAFNGLDDDYTCEIDEIKKHQLFFHIINKTTNEKNPTKNITLFQALAKGEKMELVAQKATEIGVSYITPIYSVNCDVKPNSTKPARLEKILVGACKQCGRSRLPIVNPICHLKDIISDLDKLDLVLFANVVEGENSRVIDVLAKHKDANNIGVIIGPEGGFSPEEVALLKEHSVSVSLGSRVLRTETAGLYLLSILNDFYRN